MTPAETEASTAPATTTPKPAKPVDELAVLRRVSGAVEDLDDQVRETVLKLAHGLSQLDAEASNEALGGVKKVLSNISKLDGPARARAIKYAADRFGVALDD